MYRTYKNLYKIRPAISSLGTGKQRIRLPKGVTITLDTFLVFLACLLPARYLVVPIISLFFGGSRDFPWLFAIMIAGTGAFYAGKIDPAGKPISTYIFDVVKFSLRQRTHDGWQPRLKMKKKTEEKVYMRASLVNDGQVGSLPARGKVDTVELRLPANISVKKGNVIVSRKGKQKFAAGRYRIEGMDIRPYNGIIPRKSPPSLRR